MSNWPGKPRVLFDASNLVKGGGVQVAASLAGEFATMAKDPEVVATHPWLADVSFYLSPEVEDNLVAPLTGHAVRVGRTHWLNLYTWLGSKNTPFDLQLTVFGPRYGRSFAPITVTGIADVTSIYPWPEGVDPGSIVERAKRSVRGIVARRLFRKESFLISESQSLIDSFIDRMQYPRTRTAVIPNTLNQAVADAEHHALLATNLRDGLPDGTALLGYVARAYPHKNLEFLVPLERELARLGTNVRFALTLSEAEWVGISEDLRRISINAGVIPVNAVADFFAQCDAAIFPSLLESYSATPLEAMATNGLLFASERPFVRDVCREAAAYFDPLDPVSCAHTVASVLNDTVKQAHYRQLANSRVRELPDAKSRALRFVEVAASELRDSRQKPDL